METLITYLIVGVKVLMVLVLIVGTLFALRHIHARRADIPEGTVKNVLVALGVIAALLLVVWLWPSSGTPDKLSLALEAPSPETVWGFFKDYWLWIVLVLAGLFFTFGAVGKPWAKGAKGMVIVFAVVLVGAIAVHGIWGDSSSSQQTNQGCPHYSSLADQGCTITEKPIILVTEEVTREGESKLCYLKPGSAVLLTRKVGVNSFEFRSANGVFPIRYKLVRRTDMVNGECPKKF